jgi:hypothetical protein
MLEPCGGCRRRQYRGQLARADFVPKNRCKKFISSSVRKATLRKPQRRMAANECAFMRELEWRTQADQPNFC